MAHRKDLYRFTAQLAASAVLMVVGSSPAMAAGGVGISMAALTGLHRERKSAELKTAVAEAERSAVDALLQSVEFKEADFDRAFALLQDETSAILPLDYAEAAAVGGAAPEDLIAASLVDAIRFEPDDAAAKRLLELLIGVQVRIICNHPKMAPKITRAFEIRNARGNEESLSLVRELHSIKSTTVPEDTLIAMARKISPRVANREEALRALDDAADRVAAALARGRTGSNIDDFVDAALREIASLTSENRFEEAAIAADRSVDQAEAGLAQCLAAAIDAHLVNLDAAGAARQIVRRLALDLAAGSTMFDAVMDEQAIWYERGSNAPSRLDLEVAAALADEGGRLAGNDGQRGEALNTRGVALRVIAERYRSIGHCRDAVAALRSAIDLRPRALMPDDWSMRWMNLGNALALLGDLTGSDRTLRQAVGAYGQALLERDRNRNAVHWARCVSNLHRALILLGASDPDDALGVLDRDLWPEDWAIATGNRGLARLSLARSTSDGALAALARDDLAAAVELLPADATVASCELFAKRLPEARELAERP